MRDTSTAALGVGPWVGTERRDFTTAQLSVNRLDGHSPFFARNLRRLPYALNAYRDRPSTTRTHFHHDDAKDTKKASANSVATRNACDTFGRNTFVAADV